MALQTVRYEIEQPFEGKKLFKLGKTYFAVDLTGAVFVKDSSTQAHCIIDGVRITLTCTRTKVGDVVTLSNLQFTAALEQQPQQQQGE